MNEFNPGDGWREVREPADTGDGDEVRWRSSDDSAVRYWIREVPVPPLPTEPHTVIRVTWKSGLRPDAREYVRWSTTWESEDNLLDPEELADRITGFEVLAEPRAIPLETDNAFEERVRRETAKAVIDRVRALTAPAEMRVGMIPVLVQVADDFGVAS